MEVHVRKVLNYWDHMVSLLTRIPAVLGGGAEGPYLRQWEVVLIFWLEKWQITGSRSSSEVPTMRCIRRSFVPGVDRHLVPESHGHLGNLLHVKWAEFG